MMRFHAVVAAVIGATVLAAAAVAPFWLSARAPIEPRGDVVVPFELSGLYVTDCTRDEPLADGDNFSTSFDPSGATHVELFRRPSEHARAVPVPDPTTAEDAVLDRVRDCLTRYRLTGFTPAPRLDGVQRPMFYSYLVGSLIPCLQQHGLEPRVPSVGDLRAIDVSAWYLSTVLQESDFDRALDTWYRCPLLPSFLKDEVRHGDLVVE